MHSQPLIVLDSRRRVGGSDPELLDAAVRATASLALELARGGGCHLLLPGDRVTTSITPDLGAWPSVHTRLALVEEEADPNRAPALRPAATRGTIVFVSVRLDADSALASVGVHASQLILVLPRKLGERLELPAAFEVAGCTGFLLRTQSGRRRRRVVAA